MENTDDLDPCDNLAVQGHDGSNNMLGAKIGVALQLRERHHIAIENHCMCYAAALPCKKVFNSIKLSIIFFQNYKFNKVKLPPHEFFRIAQEDGTS